MNIYLSYFIFNWSLKVSFYIFLKQENYVKKRNGVNTIIFNFDRWRKSEGRFISNAYTHSPFPSCIGGWVRDCSFYTKQQQANLQLVFFPHTTFVKRITVVNWPADGTTLLKQKFLTSKRPSTIWRCFDGVLFHNGEVHKYFQHMIVETRDPSLLKVRAGRIDTFLNVRKDSVSIIQPGKVIAKKLDFQNIYCISLIT